MKARGFTLIELMVVVAIIGLLSSIVLASLNQSKIKGNIAKRVESAKELQNALELYYLKNGAYPVDTTGHSSCAGVFGGQSATWIPNLVAQGFISVLPTDPDQNGSACCWAYKSTSNGTAYKLIFGYGGSNASPTCTPLAGAYGTYPAFIDPSRDAGADSSLQDWPGDGASTHLYDWAIYTNGGATL